MDRVRQVDYMGGIRMNIYLFFLPGTRCLDQAGGFRMLGRAYPDAWGRAASVPRGVRGCRA